MKKSGLCFPIFFILLVIAQLIIISQPAFSQYVEELYSPYFMGLGLTSASLETPMSDVYNPAASGATQRMTLDFSYIALPGFGEDEGFGHAGNLGLTIPTRVGVIGTSLHFISSSFPNANLGTMGSYYLSFSKDLFPDLLIGAGLQTQFGLQDDFSGASVGLDLGFLHMPGDVMFLKQFKWGITFKGLGLGYTPPENTELFPAPFTPSLGASFRIVDLKDFSIALFPELSAPGLIPVYANPLNLKASLGGEITLFDTIFIDGNLMFDYLEFRNTASDRPFYTFGAAIKFKLPVKDIKFLDISERGWDRSEIKANIVAVPLQDGVWGIGAGFNIPLGVTDATPPKIEIETDKEIYVSPNLDGIKDNVVLPIKITDQRYIKGYRFVVTDEAGNPVKEIANKEERQENVDLKNVMDRLLYTKQGIPVPETIRWDGESDKGAVVPDGTYRYYLEAWDDNGNIAKSPSGTVVIDATYPAVQSTTPYLIFSPNSDGNKDTLPITQTGSSEDSWKGAIKDQTGKEVASFTWDKSQPANLAWNGTNAEGVLLPDGVYQYTISSTDRAGNSYAAKIDNIIINTQATPINITIGLSDFSPNDDGIQDKIRFNLDIPIRDGIEKWELKIVNPNGDTLKTFSGTKEIPDSIDFDGKGDNNAILAESSYIGYLELKYISGNNPTSSSPAFVIDYTAPSARTKANELVFSPNGDGNKDTILFTNDTSEELSWTGEIRSKENKVVKKFSYKGRADEKVEWDGRGDNGILASDGGYTYIIYTTDKAGNYGKSEAAAFEMSTTETPVFLSVDLTDFSPNADGVQDVVTIMPHLKVETDVDTFTLTIHSGNTDIRTVTGKNKAPADFRWDGKNDPGKLSPDGEYSAELNILYKNGNNPIVVTKPFRIDTVFPSLDISSAYTLFSPDGDGKLDTFIVKQKSSPENLWEATIRNAAKETVRNFYWKGSALDAEWNGKDDNGNKLRDGAYSYSIQTSDPAGNAIKKTIDNITIDTRQTQVFLTVQSSGFSPNGDNSLETIAFQTYIGVTDGIKSWVLDITNTETSDKVSITGEKSIKETIAWDGKKDGKLMPDGTYTASLTVEYFKGNQPKAVTQGFRLDVTPPEVKLTVAPRPFSPDNDGIDDEVTIKTSVKDLSTIEQWKMEILDPMKHHFIGYKGKGIPSDTIIWDGISDTGELVQSADDYFLELEITDDLGNKAIVSQIIPVDVLVVKVGDKYKIKIPNITFKPDTADYENVEADKKDRNFKTLKRLAEIFKKYDAYRIVIEGHAVSLDWADPAKAKTEQEKDLIPLSKKRAEAIKKGLVKLGIEESRIDTVGIGGAQPVVPHGDLENRWKNRRVEFILIKNK